MRKQKLCIILTLLLINMQLMIYCKEIFIEYGASNQGNFLTRLFDGIQDGFYVDIGAYDSIYTSNTLNLYSMGWKGINVQASSDRLQKFFTMRSKQININVAIGELDKIVILHQMLKDSESTINQQIKNNPKYLSNVIKQIKMPAITMKQLCQRYYHQRPLLINLNIQGYVGRALMSNDWNNSVCVPDVFISKAINENGKESPSPEVILMGAGYQKWHDKFGVNQIYIHESVYEQYAKKYEQNQQTSTNKKIIHLSDISQLIPKLLSISTTLTPHYDPKQDNIYHYFAQYKQIINIDKIHQQSNQISIIKNRPIVIYHFNHIFSSIIFHGNMYQISKCVIGQIYFYNVTIRINDGKTYSCYVFNHQIQPQAHPKIYSIQGKTAVKITQFKQNTPNLFSQQKLKQQLKQQQDSETKKNEEIQLLSNNILITRINNQHQTKSKIQAIVMRLQLISKQQNIYNNGNYYQNSSREVNREISKIMIIQVSIFVVITIFNSLSFMLLCLRKKEMKGEEDDGKEQIEEGNQSIERSKGIFHSEIQ